jgi:hypothetical protein
VSAHIARRTQMRGRPQGERWVYQTMLAAGFMIFLVAALIECLLPWRWRGIAERWSRKSVIVEAMEAAKTTIPFAFMG